MNSKPLKVVIALLLVASLLVSYHNTPNPFEFQTWKDQFAVKFTSEFENTYRERIFLENLAKINTHNANPDRTYDMGLNQFSALIH
jgi:cathepsin L